MKKLLLAASVAAFSLPVLADSGSYTNVVMGIDGTKVAIDSVKDGMTGILNYLGPAVLAVVVAGVAIWAIPRIVGLLKSAFGSGKGR